jgi:hypothetical protein
MRTAKRSDPSGDDHLQRAKRLPGPSARLSSIAAVHAGYVERHPTADHSDSGLLALRARDLGADGAIDWRGLRPCEPIRDPARLLIRHGDVVLTTRTTQIRAVAISGPPPNVVASSQFAILRPDVTRVDARYLAWALDRAHASGRLRSLIKGSTVQYLSTSELGDLELPVPPLEQQRALARVEQLRARERELLARLEHLRDVALDAALALTRSEPQP